MKNITILFTTFFISFSFYGQEPTFDWSYKWTYNTQGTDVDVDNLGNVYLISYGDQTTNFNPNTWPVILGPTSGCGAVTKLDPSGNVIWIKFIEVNASTSGGVTPNNITVKDGFIYVSGLFGGGGGSYDFDPNSGTAISNGKNPNSEGFVLKWDLNGNYLWHRIIHTSQSWPTITIRDMVVDLNDRVLLCGSFTQSITSGVLSVTSNGGGDCYFLSLDSLGNTQFLKSFGGVDTSSDEALGICSNSSGEIYLTGSYYLSVDFDPGVGQTILNSTGSSDVFVSKFNFQGDLLWAQTFGNANFADFGSDIVLDDNENIVFTGTTMGLVDFDISAAVNVLNSNSNYAYVAKWNSNGNFIWAKGLYSDQQSQGFQLSVFNSQIILAGICSGITDFDPSQSMVNLSNSGGFWSSFLLRLDGAGTFDWAGLLENLDGNWSKPSGIAQSANSILICGWFVGSMDSNPIFDQSYVLNSLTNTAGYPGTSNFVIKLDQCVASTSIIEVTACGTYTWPLNSQTYTIGGEYAITTLNSNGCDSLIVLNLTLTPNIPEICDGFDSDCDGIVDNGFDLDNDGFTVCNGDCDDSNSGINPIATEICNGIDDNCDAIVDEGFDSDADTFTLCNGDCDDTNPLIYPSAPEVLDFLDNDCDGQIDEGLSPDADGDGFTVADGDCDDNNAGINPSATELCNGIDDNCNTQVDEGFDLDGDSFTICNGDCDDTNALIYPGAQEVLDSLDNNCDGQIDEGLNPDPDAEGDGYSISEGDCNDADPNINPGATEVCNGIDDNCNSMIDEGFDMDGDGETTCEGDCNDNNPLVNTSEVELCNDIDDNCDTYINEGLACDEVSRLIPTGISPNGDGFNDAWYLPWLSGMRDYSIIISNRWGQVIFQTNDYSAPWNGTYLGNSLPAADYFYVIKLSDNTTYEGVISIKY